MASLVLFSPFALAGEAYEYTELKTLLMNTQSELVNVRAAWHRDSDYWANYLTGEAKKHSESDEFWQKYLEGEELQRQTLAEWWKNYAVGIEQQRQSALKESTLNAARAAEAARRSR